MPSIATHMAVTKLVGERLGRYTDDFIIGNILPDLLNNPDSHIKIKNRNIFVPNIKYVKEKIDLNSDLQFGYYIHLMLDKYYLEDLFLKKINDIGVFENKILYNEYSYINAYLVREYKLDVNYITYLLSNINFEINQEKLNRNITYLNGNDIRETKYLIKDDFIKFINEISLKIYEEVKYDS